MAAAARLVCGLLAIGSLAGGLQAQSCSAFEVASIKLNVTGTGGGYPELAPGGRRFTATSQLMVELLMFAWRVSPRQISGIPDAFSKERYDIEATCAEPMTKEQLPGLLQGLLAERFHLAVRQEMREETVFALIPGKSGPKLHESPDQGGKPGLRQRGYSFTFTNAGMSNLTGLLSQVSGRKVLDRTGLEGSYDFTLSYAPGSAGSEGVPDSVFTALREQLGLDLQGQKAPVEFVIVDHLDRLIPN